jgi:small GTP-binding protein
MKMVLVGDTQIGKICLARRLATRQLQTGSLPTIGAASQNHIILTSNGPVKLQIWDTAGQEKYRALILMYCRNAQAAVLVFDLTSVETFNTLKEWGEHLEALKIFLVGKKLDLTDERQVTAARTAECVQAHGVLDHFETSIKRGDGVIDLFTTVAEAIILAPATSYHHRRPEPVMPRRNANIE